MKREIWKQLILDSHLLLSLGGACLAAYLALIVQQGNAFQVMPGVFLYFMTTYGIHAVVTLKYQKTSLSKIEVFWSSNLRDALGIVLLLTWIVYAYYDWSRAIVFLCISLLTPLYSFYRINSNAKASRQKPLVKVIVSLLVIMSILRYSLGLESLENEVSIEGTLLTLHVLWNILVGDLRDGEVDLAQGKASLSYKLNFESLKKTLMFFALLCFSLSVYFSLLEWALVFLWNFVLLWKLHKSSDEDVYHGFDLAHYIPFFYLFILQG